MVITDINGFATLNNGIKMPYLGLGVFQSKDGEEVINAILWALETGYRHIDTASIYNNERGVGEAIKKSNLKRKDIFITTKVWNTDQGYDSTLKAFDLSLKKLDCDYIDLYLIHWPGKSKFKDTWKALEYLYNNKYVRSIGVSNFMIHHLKELLQTAEVLPMVNQVEFHPYLVQQELIDYCQEKNIQFEAWSPLMQGRIGEVELIKQIASKYQKTPVQIVLRWNLQKGVVTIPKSVRRDRIISNADIFNFNLSDEDMQKIDQLDRNGRLGFDPDHFF